MQPVLGEVELATLQQRILARVIDSLLLTVVTLVVVVVIVLCLMLFAFGAGWINAENIENLISIIPDDSEVFGFNLFDPTIWVGIIITHSMFLALQGVLLHRYGQTIGKRLLKIAMVDADTHEIVPLPRLFVYRYLVWDIPALFFTPINWIIRIVDLCFAFRNNRQTLHDMTANTIVIQADNPTQLRRAE